MIVVTVASWKNDHSWWSYHQTVTSLLGEVLNASFTASGQVWTPSTMRPNLFFMSVAIIFIIHKIYLWRFERWYCWNVIEVSTIIFLLSREDQLGQVVGDEKAPWHWKDELPTMMSIWEGLLHIAYFRKYAKYATLLLGAIVLIGMKYEL